VTGFVGPSPLLSTRAVPTVSSRGSTVTRAVTTAGLTDANIFAPVAP